MLHRCLGAAMALVLVGSTVIATAHSHADGQQHRQTCAACTVLHQAQDTSPPTALPEPAYVDLLTTPALFRQILRDDDYFPSARSRAPPA